MEHIWSENSYGSHITGKAAAKLADSQIAPLVAWARGYTSINHKDDVKNALKHHGLTENGRSKDSLTSQLRHLWNTEDENALILPWFSAEQVIAADNPNTLTPKTIQARPSKTIPTSEGKSSPKYITAAGGSTPIDIHPATPQNFPENNTKVLITEGLPKADSALTAMLLTNGATVEELSDPQIFLSPNPTASARERLAVLISNIPTKHRYLIAAIVGVGNWRSDTDMRALRIKDREVIIAFDADITENHKVWVQAQRIFERINNGNGTPRLLNLNDPLAIRLKLQANFPQEEKLGMDDFLSKVGTWEQLTGMLSDLPPAPKKSITDGRKHGDWLVIDEPDKKHIIKFVKTQDIDGSITLRQETQTPLIGRVKSTTVTRTATESEILTGRMSNITSGLEKSCVVEIYWLDETGTQHTVEVEGHIDMLQTEPAKWRQLKVDVPQELIIHPKWPPKGGTGEDWLEAIKAHRQDETDHKFAWSAMGWAPTRTGDPVFIIGEQNVLGATREIEESVQVSVSSASVPNANDFGVIDNYWNLVDPDGEGNINQTGLDTYHEQVKRDIELLVRGLCFKEMWRNPAYGPIVLAAMFRPCLPLRPRPSLWLSGDAGTGKSWTAGIIMSAWNWQPGTWTNHNLPGSANDTPAAVEQVVSRTPIWVADDLAPSADERSQRTQENTISELVRTVFNGGGKNRSTATNTLRAKNDPRALLIITGEYEPSIASIKQRSVIMPFSSGSLGSTEIISQAREMCWGNGVPARVAAAMIRFAFMPRKKTGKETHDHDLTTWQGRVNHLQEVKDKIAEASSEWLYNFHGMEKSISTRQSNVIADLAISLQQLALLYLHVGGSEDDPLYKQLAHSPYKPSTKPVILERLFNYGATSLRNHRKETPGRTLISCLHDLLDSKQHHIESATRPGQPPFESVAGENDHLNRALGWEFDARTNLWVAKGESIGKAGYLGRDRSMVLWFHKQNAFDAARRKYAERLPAGMKSKQTWSSAWDENLCFGSRQGDGSDPSVKAYPVGSKQSVNGVPILVETFFNVGGLGEDEVTEESANFEEVI